MKFSKTYFDEVISISKKIDHEKVENLVDHLRILRKNKGRLFIAGVGGSASNASHMANDLRKLCEIETYSISDNISELTARANDEGWQTIFSGWLANANLSKNDAFFVLSVGGGNLKKNVSVNIINGIKFSKKNSMKVFGIVGMKSGYTARHGDCVVVIPEESKFRITPHSESFQSVVWHCLVSHPKLIKNETKW